MFDIDEILIVTQKFLAQNFTNEIILSLMHLGVICCNYISQRLSAFN